VGGPSSSSAAQCGQAGTNVGREISEVKHIGFFRVPSLPFGTRGFRCSGFARRGEKIAKAIERRDHTPLLVARRNRRVRGMKKVHVNVGTIAHIVWGHLCQITAAVVVRSLGTRRFVTESLAPVYFLTRNELRMSVTAGAAVSGAWLRVRRA
jgi:hypothetical protein